MKILAALLLALSLLTPAMAQISVQLQPVRTQYITHEPVNVIVTITNRSGRELFFRSHTKGALAVSWLDFKVNDGRGKAMQRLSNAVFRAASLPPGKSISRSVNLNQIYGLTSSGNYSVSAIIRQGESVDRLSTYQSNTDRFSITDGRVLFRQPFGVPNSPHPKREYKVLSYNDGDSTSVYVSVLDSQRGTSISTFRLSQALLFRAPQATLDSSNRLHVLYLANPAIYVHATISPDGETLDTKYYKRSETNLPALMAFSDGSIQTRGGIPYDPAEEQKAREAARKITDRP
ncbi:MAG: hypothetical protein ACQKBY_10975 [Verrucomicrobiales bacterium]